MCYRVGRREPSSALSIQFEKNGSESVAKVGAGCEMITCVVSVFFFFFFWWRNKFFFLAFHPSIIFFEIISAVPFLP